ncbi:MAG TPA: hypothetical protein VHS31_12780 [Tepidisphaeraceae bacterium]|nr:hypothetical protein [Tepidisphaeraceae bacterium]
MNESIDASQNIQWELSRRIEAWAGEIRVNLIRIVALAVFYLRHLIELFLSEKDAPIRGIYHVRVTALVVAWAGMAGAVHLLLSSRFYPPAMKFVASLFDLLMITILCTIAGGPQTPLVLLFFGVIAAAPLRLSLPVVWTTTFGSMAGYLAVLGWYAWYVIGFKTYYATPSLRIARSQEIITLLCLGVAGLFAGQVVRQARRMIERYPMLREAADEPEEQPS